MTTADVERLIREATQGNGTPVDVVEMSVTVSGDRDQLRQQLRAVLKENRELYRIVEKHRGSLNRLVEHFGGDRNIALRLMAVGAYAGVWDIQSAREMLRQPREKAIEMAKSGFLYLKIHDE